MKRFYKKLKSNRGASMVFALLIFLLCALAGTAALTAASANAGRYTRLEGEQRQYFSMASALELLQGQMDEADPVTIKVIYQETESWWYEETTPTGSAEPTYKITTNTFYGFTPDPLLYPRGNPTYYQTLLYRNCVPDEWWHAGTAKPDLPSPEADKTYVIELDKTTFGTDPPSWADTLYPVYVTIKQVPDSGNYTLEMTLTTKNSDAHPLKVVWTGEVDTDMTTEVTTTGDVLPADPANPSNPDSRGTRTTTTTLTCKLRWSADHRVVTFE